MTKMPWKLKNYNKKLSSQNFLKLKMTVLKHNTKKYKKKIRIYRFWLISLKKKRVLKLLLQRNRK